MTDEMTDEMLDRLEALSSHVVLRFADTEIAVVPVLVAEVKRLRKALDEHDTARMTAELLLERERRTSDSHFGMSVMYEKEYERARDILAALREPSEAVVKAVKDAIYEELGIDYWDGKTRRILYYAVAAAEQEVRHDER